MPGEGMNFFSDFRENTIKVVYPEDQNRVFTALAEGCHDRGAGGQPPRCRYQ